MIIGTTKWQRIKPEVGLNRVKQLSDGDKYWKPLVTKGSMVRKFEDTHESAWGFVDIVLKKVIVIPWVLLAIPFGLVLNIVNLG